MAIKKILLFGLYFTFLTTTKLFAAWSGPTTTVAGTWGTGTTQFGLETGDVPAYDTYPDLDAIMGNGDIVIGDLINKRTEVYTSQGTINIIISWNTQRQPDGSIIYTNSIPKYKVGSHDLGYDSNQNLWSGGDNYFALISVTGDIVTTTSTRPIAVGITTGKCMTGKLLSGCKNIQYNIEYPDVIYIYQEGTRYADFSGQVRIGTNTIMDNQAGYVYAFSVTQTTTVPGSKPLEWLGWTATWTKPADAYGTPVNDGVETVAPVVAQYGSPIIGSDGSIYCWKRTQTNYSVLKWTWSP